VAAARIRRLSVTAQIRISGLRVNSSALLTGLVVFLLFNLMAPISAEARITRLEITRVESPTFEGASFGEVGQYEKIVARAFGEVDPNDQRNRVIADIALAPRNSRGNVEYSTDVYILKPINRAAGNHRIFYEINNRGNSFSLEMLNSVPAAIVNDPAAVADAGNGYLMHQGYTIVSNGWDFEATLENTQLAITVPVAKNPDGSTITGPSYEYINFDNAKGLRYRLAYPVVGYGPPLLNRLALHPDLFALFPKAARRVLSGRILRAGGSPGLRGKVERTVRVSEGVAGEGIERDGVVRLRLSDGSVREADAVIVAAGFRFSLERLAFLSPEVRERIAVEEDWPFLDRWFRSTENGLLFVGFAAEHRFGPIARIIPGTRFTANRAREALTR